MKNDKTFATFILLMFCVTAGISQITLPEIIRDSMVIQRNAKITIWGWASPGERITATFNGKQRKTSADSEGDWSLEFPKMKAGGPYTLEISGKNN